MTTMVRLARKGLLLRRRDGQAYVYIATCTEAEFVELQIAAIKRGIGE
jgi:predicted transcriptional regulator